MVSPMPQCTALASAMKRKGEDRIYSLPDQNTDALVDMSYKDIAEKMGKSEEFVVARE